MKASTTLWFHKKRNLTKVYFSRCISISFLPQHWKFMSWKDNGAKIGVYDLNIWFLGFHFSYTNWDYNK